MVTAYLAHAMTGRTGQELIEESKNAKYKLNMRGIKVLDPVEVEGVSSNQGVVAASNDQLTNFWKRDKELIQAADVILDLTGPAKSEGVSHEIGYGRYCLWIPVVRLYPSLGPSVARLEDDVIVDTLDKAADCIQERWGSYDKRLMWRLSMLGRCLPKFVLLQLKRLFQ